ncbi:glycoside hydrolase family 2 TIM barrel-domain containing protein [Robertkochia sediminum]|uniref:glycoside hydrolase family 2 TIM barrel-domain containing protein n=1 Tax=Robertkochia sediminum TaxID=2785326 RepID=UPI001932F366|nr:glycoside hydrolase family 2 TIM barrel-domain containing protein [Robertkochia sediminum]MBL7472770.1 hypothetical protein [Robertkochia sediminum]
MRKYLLYILGGTLLATVLFFLLRKRYQPEVRGKVYIERSDQGFQLIRNGAPFKIKGASGSLTYLDRLKASGGNTIRFYDTLNLKRKLDSAQKHGIAVIADIPLPSYNKDYNPYATPAQREHIDNLVRNFVTQYKDHPALLMWVLGNEINYPNIGSGGGFTKYYNDLIQIVKQTDPDHPVTTAISQAGRHLILNLYYRSDLDLIAINSFGGVKEMEKDLKQIELLWDGPYLISEWNDEGPWSKEVTKWGAPLEPTSSKKAERLAEVYKNNISPLEDRCLGSLIFYWGYKHERTHTWFSLFSEEGESTPSVYALEQIFREDTSITYEGPQLDFLMLNRYGPQESMLLNAGQENIADVFYNAPDCDSISISWEILPEIWTRNPHSKRKEEKPIALNHLILESKENMVRFKTPEKEGPYRIFTYIKDHKGNIATANFPFYVINQAHVQN